VTTVPVRREAAPFRPVVVRRTERLTPHMARLTLGGPALAGLPMGLPAGSIRVLLPPPEVDHVVVPTWNGNEFLLADGRRPVIRTFTPRRFDEAALELDVDVVLHEHGAVAAWAAAAAPGSPVGVSGTGRGYAIDAAARGFLLGGDESAIPAISVLLETLPAEVAVRVLVEVSRPDARFALPAHPGATVDWYDLDDGADRGDALHGAVTATVLDPDIRVWVAGEAAAMQRIRRHLFDDRGLARDRAHVRGYWKHGRAGGTE
jgi:NADPH-dependent ferric siderophore reductase